MICEIGRYLHQPMNDVMEWSDDDFLLTHAEISSILSDEQPKKD